MWHSTVYRSRSKRYIHGVRDAVIVPGLWGPDVPKSALKHFCWHGQAQRMIGMDSGH